MTDGHTADPQRYEGVEYRRVGRSGLFLPPISLGLWQNFGAESPLDRRRTIIRRAFDLGVTHFDLANNYGVPYGSAEEGFGEVLRRDLGAHRDELVVSTKAGYDMWPGPYGEAGSRKHLLASLDRSLSRLGLDYVDIFYSHRADPDTPLEETATALHDVVSAGKALYVGVSSYSAERTRQIAELLRSMGTPLLIHQPSYSMFNRWIEGDLLASAKELGIGVIAFSVLAQGVLSDRYLNGVAAGSRASRGGSLQSASLTPETLDHVRALHAIARERGQALSQLAISWALRTSEISSVLIGVSSVEQLETNLAAAQNLAFDDVELRQIDAHAIDLGIDLWQGSRRESTGAADVTR